LSYPCNPATGECLQLDDNTDCKTGEKPGKCLKGECQPFEAPGASCAGWCGQPPASEDGCGCDEECEKFGDCCGDVCEACTDLKLCQEGNSCWNPFEVGTLPFHSGGDTGDAGSYYSAGYLDCADAPFVWGQDSQEQVWMFVPSQTGEYYVFVQPVAGHNADVYVATGCSDFDSTCVGAVGSGSLQGDRLVLTFEADAGEAHYLLIDGRDSSGEYELLINRTPILCEDIECSDAPDYYKGVCHCDSNCHMLNSGKDCCEDYEDVCLLDG